VTVTFLFFASLLVLLQHISHTVLMPWLCGSRFAFNCGLCTHHIPTFFLATQPTLWAASFIGMGHMARRIFIYPRNFSDTSPPHESDTYIWHHHHLTRHALCDFVRYWPTPTLSRTRAHHKPVDSARCPGCGIVTEVVRHFLLDCPGYR
jgi:hypothetical protein